MSKFDYMNFYGGFNGQEFVCHAQKYTKEQAVDLCMVENDTFFDGTKWVPQLRRPTVDDVHQDSVAYYLHAPSWCGWDDDGRGCYTFCRRPRQGSFPVWVIRLDELAQKEG